jgi:hypothetical protein
VFSVPVEKIPLFFGFGPAPYARGPGDGGGGPKEENPAKAGFTIEDH